MGEGGQYPSHPRPAPPPPASKVKTCLDFDQDKNIAGQGKFLKPKRSGLGPIRREGTDWLNRGSTALRGGQHKRIPPTEYTDGLCVLQQAERHMEVSG